MSNFNDMNYQIFTDAQHQMPEVVRFPEKGLNFQM